MTSALAGLTRDQRNTFVASFLGWSLDAFDFFLVIVVLSHVADNFGTTVASLAIANTLTLGLRPVGALLFGWLGDRYGRRVPLMIDVAVYSLIELLTAFSPNILSFIILRALYGIAMGGEWGLGAALAMEALPPSRRGLFSGILQEGYAVGYLLAGLALALFYTHIGWRGMFVIGVLPAALIFFIRARVPESKVWKAGKARSAGYFRALADAVKSRWPLFLYAIPFMAAFNFMSHGTQDPFPAFLTKQLDFNPGIVGSITAIASIGAICGGIFFGWASQRFGRRNSIIVCALVGIMIIPLWAYSHTFATLAAGGFFMQFAVQGAWGIIPAHLNELSPPAIRGTFPGFVYQVGNLIAAGTLQIIAARAQARPLPDGHPDYSHAMAGFIIVVFVGVIVMTVIGHFVAAERREAVFTTE
ncbi:MAG: MFS transporter [Candidatus Eremiobacteraeota bacterium]|nr:MFS transporter [Candidatus Eremiobacteraeota bacterium]